MSSIEDRARSYGVRIDGPIDSEMMTAQREAVSRDGGGEVYWNDPQLSKVTCLRLIGASRREYPWWDVSFCYGVLKDGTQVRVQVPFGGQDLPMYGWKRAIVEAAKRDGVFAKGLGILDNVSQLYG